jgi:hypothetical protein
MIDKLREETLAASMKGRLWKEAPAGRRIGRKTEETLAERGIDRARCHQLEEG